MSKNIEITESTTHYNIAFPFNPFIVKSVKTSIPGSWYDGVNKIWKAPKSSRNHVHLFASRFKVNMSGQSTSPEEVGEVLPMPELTVEIPGLKLQPFPFQRNGIAYILEKKRLIIGDQMGLGKTGQAICAMEYSKPFPALIICPSSLKLNWQREISKWTNRKSIILADNIKSNFHRYYEAGFGDYFITNFESLKKYFVERIKEMHRCPVCKKEYEEKTCPVHHCKLAKSPMRLAHVVFKENINLFKSVIIDESHRCKALSAQQTKYTKGICIGKEWILALTGTPVVNKPIDLIAQLGIIERIEEHFGGYKAFENRYCSGQRQASNLRELNYKLNKHCFYRRDKSEVLKDLPAKMRQVVLCEIDTRKEYSDALADLGKYLSDYKKASDAQVKKSLKGEIMVRIGILKNISARGKLNDVMEFVKDTIDSGEKLVLFCHLREVIAKIKTYFPEAVSVTGEDSTSERDAAVTAFQNNPDVKLIVCSIQAAGVGLTLTASSRVAFVELGWHPAIHDQCEDRCHRIGQTDSVQCTYFLGRDTIDEWVYKIIDEKRGITNEITGALDDVEVSVVDNIINLFNQPK